MTKKDYIPPYDDIDVDFIMEKLTENYIIEEVSNLEEYDELESIIKDSMEEYNNSILNNDELDEDEDMDFQDLKENMYQAIEDSVIEKYKKAIK